MRFLYQYDDYIPFIKDWCKLRSFSFRKLAEKSGINASFFSRVIVGKAHFSREQLFLIAETMELEGWRLEYFLLLGDFQSAAHYKLKTFAQRHLQRIRREQEKVAARLKSKSPLHQGLQTQIDYYATPLT